MPLVTGYGSPEVQRRYSAVIMVMHLRVSYKATNFFTSCKFDP